ncbi:hypothetical protein NEIG_01784 [Nematocida sp. ERTm5]|nr:hypothetical protein NEIG_01784 [Nematocida sp. ERTm5]
MFNINNEIQKSKLYYDISDINRFNTDNFKNNIITNYLKSIESDILGINGHKNNSYIRTTILPIVIIFMIISIIILSIILLYSNEANC